MAVTAAGRRWTRPARGLVVGTLTVAIACAVAPSARGTDRPAAAAAGWSAESLPAIATTSDTGPRSRPLTGVVVPLRSLGVATTTVPTLLVDDLGSPTVIFRVEAISTGRATEGTVDVVQRTARWLVPGGILVPRESYHVSVRDARTGTVLFEQTLLVDLQRGDRQQAWGYSGMSVTEVGGEPIVSWASPGLDTIAGTAGFTLQHRPTNAAQAGLPDGWVLTPSSGAGGRWKSLLVTRNGSEARVTAWDGATFAFERSNDIFVPVQSPYNRFPAGMYLSLSNNPDRSWTLTDTNSVVTTFPAGNTDRAVTLFANGVWNQSGPARQGGWGDERLYRLTDPVSGRRMEFVYAPSSTCAAPAPGFMPAPAGLLCAVRDWAGASTTISYVGTDAGPQIARISAFSGTGQYAQVTDAGYDASGRIVALRQPLAAAAIAANVVDGLTSSDPRAQTSIEYDTAGRVSRISAPANLVSGSKQTAAQNTRSSQTFQYTTDRDGLALFTVRQAGTSPPIGYISRSTTNPATMERIRSAGPTGTGTVTTWNTADQATDAVDEVSGTTSRTIYDANGMAISTLGPSRRPLSGTNVPRMDTGYDQEDLDPRPDRLNLQPIEGLVQISFDNGQFGGIPAARSVGPLLDGVKPPRASFRYASNPSGRGGAWTARLSGTYVPDRDGVYQFRSTTTGVRLWVDQYACTTTSPCSVTLRKDVATPVQVSVVSDAQGAATLNLQVSRPGSGFDAIPTRDLRPNLRQITSQTIYDQLAPGRNTRALTKVSVFDPASGNLVSETTASGATTHYAFAPYTGQNNNWGQQTSITNTAGQVTNFQYYGPTETARGCANPLGPPAGPFVQGGLLARTDLTGGIYTTQVRNDAGNTMLATGNGTRTCIIRNPDRSAASGEVTGTGPRYASSTALRDNNPLITEQTKTIQGSTTAAWTSIAITGQVFQTSDPFGTVTTHSYDPWTGHKVQTRVRTARGDERTSTMTYDQLGRAVASSVDGRTMETADYRPDGTIRTITYANGTSSAMALDDNNNLRSVTYSGFDSGVVLSDTQTNSAGDATLIRDISGPDGTARFTAEYDLDHRLIASHVSGSLPATITDTTMDYSGPSGSNGNRRTETEIPNATDHHHAGTQPITSSFTYDDANRLLSSTKAGLTGRIDYDTQGRTTRIGSSTLEYDAGGRLTRATGPRGSFEYSGNGDVIYRPASGPSITVRDSGGLLLDPQGRIVGQIVDLSQGVRVALDATGTPVTWQYSDLQGSATWTTTGNQAPGSTTLYDPWGNRITPTVPVITPTTPVDLVMSMGGWKGTSTPASTRPSPAGSFNETPAAARTRTSSRSATPSTTPTPAATCPPASGPGSSSAPSSGSSSASSASANSPRRCGWHGAPRSRPTRRWPQSVPSPAQPSAR
jgi:YD repeat-containing protein